MANETNLDTSLPFEDFHRKYYGYTIVVISFIIWRSLAQLVASIAPGLQLVASRRHDWKFKNCIISLIHSSITGIGGLICFYLDPDMAQDLINRHAERCFILGAVSIGYFLHDLLDLRHSRRHEWELYIHHIIVLMCFGSCLITKQYIGYKMVAFLVEINSIFLHIRTLLQVCGVSKFSLAFRFNSLLNIATFVVNRIMVLAWMTRWLVINKDLVPFLLYTLGCISNAIMTLINIILLYRLLRADQKVIASTLFGKTDIGTENLTANGKTAVGIVNNGIHDAKLKEQ